MKIVAKVAQERKQLVENLRDRGIIAKLVRNGVVIELPMENGHYVIPEGITDATLFIDLAEHGGGMTNTGAGIIVCGLSGKRLRPYYCPRRGHLSNSSHAFFSVKGSVVTVTGYYRDPEIEIRKHTIIEEGKTASIETEELWSGEIEFLPVMYQQYLEAVEAAQEKASCYHCREPHYIAE